MKGHEDIQKFIIDLPTSDHTLVTLDAQPILGMYIITDNNLLKKATKSITFFTFESNKIVTKFLSSTIHPFQMFVLYNIILANTV